MKKIQMRTSVLTDEKKNSLNLQCRKKILKCFTIALLGLQQNQRFYFYISP